MPIINQNQFHAKTSSYEASTQLASINTLFDSNGQAGTTHQYLRGSATGEILWSPLGSGVPGTTGATGATGSSGATGDTGPTGQFLNLDDFGIITTRKTVQTSGT